MSLGAGHHPLVVAGIMGAASRVTGLLR